MFSCSFVIAIHACAKRLGVLFVDFLIRSCQFSIRQAGVARMKSSPFAEYLL